MSGMSLTVEKNRLPELKRIFPDEVDTLVREQVFQTESDVKTNIVAYNAIDTGNMMNTTNGRMTGRSEGEVTSPAEYSAYVNYGTRYTAGRAFFTDAVDTARKEFPESFRALESRL